LGVWLKVVQHLPSKLEALSSVPEKKKKKKKTPAKQKKNYRVQ
jgi:hypothetical protein